MTPANPSLCRRSRWLLMPLLLILTATPMSLLAQEASERPKAVELLPDRTAVYVQIDNIQELIVNMKESNFGRMMADERIAPLLSDLYGQAQDAYKEIEEDVSVSLDELKSLPTGEICFAILTPRRKEPVFAFLMDVSEGSEIVDRLIARGQELALDDGAEMDGGEAEGMEYKVLKGDDGPLYYVLHEGTFLACTDEDQFTEMIMRWKDNAPEKDRTLAKNRKFITLMNKCKSTDDLPMAFSFFVDPIMMLKSATAKQPGMRLFLGALPVLGLDRFDAVGGAALFNEMNYESVFHGHVLLGNPRGGIFEMIALQPGFYEPEEFVPDDAVTYMTSNWDFGKFMAELETIVDTFIGEGSFQKQIDENINEQLEIDFNKDFIDNLKGRITYLAWMNENPTLNAQSNALVIELDEPEKGIELIEAVLKRIDDEQGEDDEGPLVEEEYKGVTIYRAAQSNEDRRDERRRRWRARSEGVEVEDLEDDDEDDGPSVEMRMNFPCFCIIENSFVFTESPEFLEFLIDTLNEDHDRLVDNEEFKQTMKDMRRLLDGNLPSMLFYARPDRTLKNFYDLLDTENTREMMEEGAEENEWMKNVKKAMDDNPLPAFEDIAHYFPPQGGFVTNDETGFHLLFFQRRAEEKDD